MISDGVRVTSKTRIAEWDPFTTPILATAKGKVEFEDLVVGQTLDESIDTLTGRSRKVVMDYKDDEMKPKILLRLTAKRENRFFLPVGANILVNEGDELIPGEVIAKIPRETTKTKDITGGLPRVAELFEARKPKEVAIITENDGVVSFGKDTKGKRKVIVTPEVGDPREYLIGKGKHVVVQEGDFLRAGQQLHAGSSNPHDILAVKGEIDLAKYLVDEVQEIYRLQGVRINDKHIEVIVRQMLRRVRITDSGDSVFLAGDQVEKARFKRINGELLAEGKQPATAEPMLLGITKASLATESFISAASFQETTKVLTEAAVRGATDHLRGLKENVIMGRLIPAGTGMSWYAGIEAEVPSIGAQADDDLTQALDLGAGLPQVDLYGQQK